MFNRISHRIVRIAFAGLISATVVLSPGIAEAKGHKPPCYGASCRGKDPAKMGCDRDARTIAVAKDARGEVRVELRYSKMCNARWARTTVKAGFPSSLVYAQLGSGAVTRHTSKHHMVWSQMWSGAIKACGGAYSKGPLVKACTVAH